MIGGIPRAVRFAPGETDSAHWNPLGFDELPEDWEKLVVHVERIAHTIYSPPEGSEETHWTTEARSLFLFFALFRICTTKARSTSLSDVLKFALASDLSTTLYVRGLLADNQNLPEKMQMEGNAFTKKEEREASSVFSSFRSILSAIDDPISSRNLSTSDFRLSDLRKKDSTVSIYLMVNPADQARLKPILTIFFELATLKLIEREPAKDEPNVTFFLDEFPRLGRMLEVVQLPAISRSFGVNVLYIVQSFSQLRTIYGHDRANELRNTCSFHVVFTQNETEIAKDVSTSIGNTTRRRISRSYQAGRIEGSTSSSLEGVPLVLPQDIMSMRQGEILVLVQGFFQRPIRAKVPMYFKDKRMLSRTQIPPPELFKRSGTD